MAACRYKGTHDRLKIYEVGSVLFGLKNKASISTLRSSADCWADGAYPMTKYATICTSFANGSDGMPIPVMCSRTRQSTKWAVHLKDLAQPRYIFPETNFLEDEAIAINNTRHERAAKAGLVTSGRRKRLQQTLMRIELWYE